MGTPLQASAASANNDASKVISGSTASAVADAAGAADASQSDMDVMFKNRTFDLYWVDKAALMYKDGMGKSYDKEARKAVTAIKRKSSIPIILRDMAPPEGSIFDPAKKWLEHKEQEKKNLAIEQQGEKGKKKSGGKKNAKKQSTADSIKESNAADKDKKEHMRDLQKLSNLKTLKALQ